MSDWTEYEHLSTEELVQYISWKDEEGFEQAAANAF